MSSMQPVLAPKAKRNYMPIIIGILLLLAAIGIGYLVVTTTTTTTVSPTARNPLAVNPELKTLMLSEKAVSEQFLAQNPEFITVQRYEAMRTVPLERTFLAQNPELSTARRYASIHAPEMVEHNFLAANPEIMIYRRYVNR